MLTSKKQGAAIRIVSRIPDADKQKQQELIAGSWVKLKEPKNSLTAILESIPFMVLNAMITLLIAGMFVPLSFGYFGIAGSSFSYQINLPVLVFGALGILVAHELIHLLCIPDFIRSETTSLGITYGGGFVYTEEQLTRTRYLMISFAPFIALSIILPFILGMLNLLSPVIIVFLLLNSLGSSVDLLIALHVLIQVPFRAFLVSNGKDSYWKLVG
jgi:vacuolar-type H+-ATPase subunit I/STV1